jgi:hypothetical protein
MEKAIFSYWPTTDDPRLAATNWCDPRFHLYSWVLAVMHAKKWFKEVELVTDSAGEELFTKILKLPFSSISTALDEISDYDKGFWALGKVKAYEIQPRPFIHLDSDAILYAPFSPAVLSAPLLGQNREDNDWFDKAYGAEIDWLNEHAAFLPESWGKTREAVCMGIYGCSDMDFNKEYCRQVFQLLDGNMEFWKTIQNKGSYCVVFEQYLASCVAAQMGRSFHYLADPFDGRTLEKIGYIHIWGGKKSVEWLRLVERLVYSNYHNFYRAIGEYMEVATIDSLQTNKN